MIAMSVHPHACGEHMLNDAINAVIGGSSPRLWGTLRDHVKCINTQRFIPTPVGNTLLIEEVEVTTPVHPHACGEHNCTG